MSINSPLTLRLLMPLKYHVIENIMENGAFAPFSIIFRKVFKILLQLFLIFFNIV